MRFTFKAPAALVSTATALVLACGLGNLALGQAAFPDRSISLVVPFAAGGPTDVVARMIAVPMGKALGQTVLVENAVGAGGTIAATKVARATPNGYTIFLHHMGMSTAPALYKKLQFDPLKDFEYIGQVVDVPMTLLARKDFPASNFKELEAYLKVNKDKVSLANAGLGAIEPGQESSVRDGEVEPIDLARPFCPVGSPVFGANGHGLRVSLTDEFRHRFLYL